MNNYPLVTDPFLVVLLISYGLIYFLWLINKHASEMKECSSWNVSQIRKQLFLFNGTLLLLVHIHHIEVGFHKILTIISES